MSCNRFYKIVCYRNEEVEDDLCCGASKTGRKYLNGVALLSNGKLIHMIERPYHVSEVGGIVTLKDAFEEEVKFKASQTVYSRDELIDILNDCNKWMAGESVFNIDQAEYNGDGTYSITEEGDEGDMAFDNAGNVYEFRDGRWTLKISDDTSIDKSSFFDYFRRAYLATKDGDHTNRVDANKIVVSNVNVADKTFETNINPDLLQELDFNPLSDGKKWAGYVMPFRDPAFQIEKYENGVFTYSLSGVSTSRNPSNGQYLELLNPFVNYENVHEDESPLIPGIGPGSTFDGVQIEYPGPHRMFRRNSKEFVLIFSIRIAGGDKRYYQAVSEDLVTWKPITPHFLENSDSPLPVTNLALASFTDIGNGEYLALFTGYGSGFQTPLYCRMDSDLNIIEPIQVLEIQGYTYPGNYIRILDFVKHGGKWRMMIWRADSSIPTLERPTIEIVFDGTLSEILDGTSSNTKTIVHEGHTGQGYTYGWIDQWQYLPYNGKLFAVHSMSDLDSTNGDFITINNREFCIAILDDEWKINSGGPSILNPIQWDKIDSKYYWQRDHLGGLPILFENQGDFYGVFDTNSVTSTYNLIGIKLKGTGGIEKYVSDYIEVNTDYTAGDKHTILADSTDNQINIDLPDPAEHEGEVFTIKKTSTTNTITIDSPFPIESVVVLTQLNGVVSFKSVLNSWVIVHDDIDKDYVDALGVDATTLDGNAPSDFATAAQGAKADTAVQTETDPTVPGYVKSITQQNITDWDAKPESSTQLTDSADLIRNDQDSYTSEPKVVQIITLTEAEKNAISTPIVGALYITPEP